MHTKIFTGPMFSGKTRKLVMDLEKFVIAKKHVLWFEPTCDTRGGSHGDYIAIRMKELKNSEYVHTQRVDSPEEILTTSEAIIEKYPIVAIYVDEYHMLDFQREFFYNWQCSKVSEIPITFSGLITGYDASVLLVAQNVLPFMDEIVKENAICMDCGKSANYYAYVGNYAKEGVIDNGKNYKCLCHNCYMKLTEHKPISTDPYAIG